MGQCYLQATICIQGGAARACTFHALLKCV